MPVLIYYSNIPKNFFYLLFLEFFCNQAYHFLLLHCIVQLYTKDASKNWKHAGSDGSSQLTMKEPSANVVLLDYIASEKWQDIVDFDDHLDDISK